MEKIVIIFLDSLILAWVLLYVSSKLLNKKINYKSRKYWIVFFIQTFYLTISYLITDSYLRVIVTYILLSALTLLLFEDNVIKTIIGGFITMFFTFIAEIIYAIILTFVFKINAVELQEVYFGGIITNLMIAIIMFLLINIEKLCSLFSGIIADINFEQKKMVLPFSILSLSILAVVLYYIYFEVDLGIAFILSLFVIVSFSLLTIFFFKEKRDNYELQLENKILLKSFREYEVMYQRERMANHEYKNQLSVMRGLIKNNNAKKLISYIDEIIDLKEKNNEKWLEKLKRIPEGGLRGLFYYKLLTMDEKNINVDFDVSRDFTISMITRLNENTRNQLYQILGVYLDNAIQAAEKTDKGLIKISIYNTEESNGKYLVISIMNNYTGIIEFDKINQKGYSTKGKGRGLGLSIVSEVLEQNPEIENKTKIIKNNFMQELRIKI